MWTARLILQLEPKWLRNFYLCELDKSQFELLEKLKHEQPDEKGRTIDIHRGDCNTWIPSILSKIKEKEATFCLLDQRTFECQWKTVEAVAHHKKDSNNKIEIFYFLPNAWLGRAIAATRDKKIIRQWWGRSDWKNLEVMTSSTRRESFTERFRELGYRSVKPWPIYDKKEGRRIMYWMIHATDHLEAPTLMRRAYEKAVTPLEPPEQIRFEFQHSSAPPKEF